MPILDPHSIEYISRSADQTRRAGMRLGNLLDRGDIVCLVGELGAGKTTFVQGIAAGWGSPDHALSPTFVLVNVYRRSDGAQLYHLDAYRINHPIEAEELDIDSMLINGPLVVEWADRIKQALPKHSLWIEIRWIDQNQRDFKFSAHGDRHEQIQAHFRRKVFGVT